MTVQSKSTLKTYFETGDVPTAQNYIDLIDSFVTLDGTSQALGGTVSVSGTFNFIDSAGSARTILSQNRSMFLTKVSAQGGINTSTVSAANVAATEVTAGTLEIRTSHVEVFASIAASGSTQGQANLITTPYTRVINASAGIADGIILPSGTKIGDTRKVWNRSTDNLNVYPESGSQINSLSTNTAYVVSASAPGVGFHRITSTQWYT